MAKKKPKYHVRPDGLHEAIRVINGKRIAFRGKSDAEVERKMIECQPRLAQGRPFSAVADDWEREHFESVAPNTLRAYRPALARAVEHFGDELILEITPPDIKKFDGDPYHQVRIPRQRRPAPHQSPKVQGRGSGRALAGSPAPPSAQGTGG